MKVLCADVTDTCPKGLNICCGTCDDREVCPNVCGYWNEWETCGFREMVSDEVVPFESAGAVVIERISTLMRLKKELEDQEKQLKQDLVKAMEVYGVKSFENDLIKMVYVAPTTRSTIDSTKLKNDHPELVKQYTKTSDVSASVRVTVK